MPVHIRPLTLLVDAEHACFVRPEAADNTLKPRSRGNPEQGHVPMANHRHALLPKELPDWVAKQLDTAVSSYDALYITAPAKILSEIQAHLTKPVQAKVKDTLDKDLTKTPDHEVWTHVRHWVRPLHRTA